MSELPPKKRKHPADTNRLAKSIVDQATSEQPEQEKSAKAKAGRKGGLKGGKSRRIAISDERRSEIARMAASARWKKKS